MKLFVRDTPQGKTHDYTVRGWGHDFAVTRISEDGKKVEASGWGYGIQKGDYLLLPNGPGHTRYKASRIRYMSDPTDMWFATLTFAPR